MARFEQAGYCPSCKSPVDYIITNGRLVGDEFVYTIEVMCSGCNRGVVIEESATLES